MSILVGVMKMPRNCIECPLQFGGICYVQPPEIDDPFVAETVDEAAKGRTNWCPLVSIPPHGRLIDASEKIRVQIYDDMTEDYHMVDMTIDDLLSQGWIEANAPTIIEAEGSET